MHQDKFSVAMRKSNHPKRSKLFDNDYNRKERLIINVDGISGSGKSTIVKLLSDKLKNSNIISSITKDIQQNMMQYQNKQIQSDIIWNFRKSNWKMFDNELKYSNIIIDRSLLSTMTYQQNNISYIQYKIHTDKLYVPKVFILLYTSNVDVLYDRLIAREGTLSNLDKIENPDKLNERKEYIIKISEINELFYDNFQMLKCLNEFKDTKFLQYDVSRFSIDEIVNSIMGELNE